MNRYIEITARQAAPGTRIKIESIMADGQPWYGWVIVGRWVGRGDGTASLRDDKGRHRGFYTADARFLSWK